MKKSKRDFMKLGLALQSPRSVPGLAVRRARRPEFPSAAPVASAPFVCEETGRGIVLIKALSGQVIGVEKLHFSVPALDSVRVETTGG